MAGQPRLQHSRSWSGPSRPAVRRKNAATGSGRASSASASTPSSLVELTPASRLAAGSSAGGTRKLTCSVLSPSNRPARRASSRTEARSRPSRAPAPVRPWRQRVRSSPWVLPRASPPCQPCPTVCAQGTVGCHTSPAWPGSHRTRQVSSALQHQGSRPPRALPCPTPAPYHLERRADCTNARP